MQNRITVNNTDMMQLHPLSKFPDSNKKVTLNKNVKSVQTVQSVHEKNPRVTVNKNVNKNVTQPYLNKSLYKPHTGFKV